MQLPKLIITDIDGVWTDGGMYYDETGNELKKFNTSDSWGVKLCHILDIKIAILSGENTQIVKNRAKKLGIDHCFLGITNKLEFCNSFLKELQIDFHSVAFIGDDINDYELFEKVAYKACPNNAPIYIKNKMDFVCLKNGGEGAFREFVEHLILNIYTHEEMISLLIKNH